LGLVLGDARRYGIGPFAVSEAPQYRRASDLQALVAAERDHVADGVVELDHGHPSTDHRARIRTGLNTCGDKQWSVTMTTKTVRETRAGE